MDPFDQRPPCMRDHHTVCPNRCAQERYERLVNNHFDLTAEWTGWGFRGRFLVNRHRERITPQGLDRLMYRYERLWLRRERLIEP